ncbi:MAG: hypothetical protein PHQ00_06300 [Phycisphaerae bacterium]|nr:hypothetical protein [Phycisphaerae bacterium]
MIWLFTIALIKIALMTFTTSDVAIYIMTAAAIALLQQANDETPPMLLTTETAKKHITAMLIEIALSFNGIIS